MIRHAIKSFLINSVTLYVVSMFIYGIFFEKGVETMVLTGIALAVTALIIKPVINILLLPLNLITFGLFRWVGYAVALYVVTLVVPGFKIADFIFKGLSTYWFSLPGVTLHGILAFIAFSLVISVISSTFDWLLK